MVKCSSIQLFLLQKLSKTGPITSYIQNQAHKSRNQSIQKNPSFLLQADGKRGKMPIVPSKLTVLYAYWYSLTFYVPDESANYVSCFKS